MTIAATWNPRRPPRVNGGLRALRTALAWFVAAALASQERRMQARTVAMLDDHLLRDLGLPPRPLHVVRSVRFI